MNYTKKRDWNSSDIFLSESAKAKSEFVLMNAIGND